MRRLRKAMEPEMSNQGDSGPVRYSRVRGTRTEEIYTDIGKWFYVGQRIKKGR